MWELEMRNGYLESFLSTQCLIISGNKYYYTMSVNRNTRRLLLPSRTLEKRLGKLRIRILVFVLHLDVDIHFYTCTRFGKWTELGYSWLNLTFKHEIFLGILLETRRNKRELKRLIFELYVYIVWLFLDQHLAS